MFTWYDSFVGISTNALVQVASWDGHSHSSSLFSHSPADATFTLTNVLSTLETVQEWNKLGDKLHVPYTKQDSKDTMMNYYVTSIANASWQMLAGALYYCGEQTALKKVKAYFQRQRGMRWRHQLPGHLGIEYSA